MRRLTEGDDYFARFLGPLVFALLVAALAHHLTVTIQGRWRPVTRNIDVALGLLTCAALTWVLFAGPVYRSAEADRTVKFAIAVIVAMSLIDLLFKTRRLIRRPYLVTR